MDHLAVTSKTTTFPLSCATLITAAVSSSVALCCVYRQLRSSKPENRFYDDPDGCATPGSLADFSNKNIKSLILLLSIVGTATSVSDLVLSTAPDAHQSGLSEGLMYTAAWGLVLIHATCLALHHDPVATHHLGAWLSATACLLTISSFPCLSYLATRVPEHRGLPAPLLRLVSTGAAVCCALAGGMLPRRPEVSHDGDRVDRQWTVSLLNRLTWTWIQPLLRQASLHNDVDVADIPCADSRLRSQGLRKQWDGLVKKSSLFASLASAYKRRLAILWTVVLLRCFVSILPFWFMLQLLQLLEDETATPNLGDMLTLIVCMAVANLLDSWMEGWLYWYSLADLALPIRSQMSGLIFEKALRRKHAKAASADDSVADSETDSTPSSGESASTKSHQAIVNLVGIDTERLSYFFQYHFLILNGVAKLAIFSFFLVRLLGWIPFGAGLLAWAATLPPNTWFSRKVLLESQNLMRQRDVKLTKIHEVLVGIRQIKFSALESQWEKRILALREAELKTLWRFFLADSGLFACWVISPILLAVASLVAYVLVNGSLLPSVAFVSIGIQNSLETTLGSLPELLTLALDSLVSLRRISTYFDEPERQEVASGGAHVSLTEACLAWPVDDHAPKQNRFTLGNLSLSFPHGALSVICGKVGSGKTLLLSAIIGEADLLSGSLQVPNVQSSDHDVTKPDQWIVPGTVAYVSHTPWLENASLRDNILFGLPLSRARYNKVLDACALKQDLTVLPDGDATELGANGVNLSGGQKWRVTLARAVYSRAEILLMEDIFSAVDSPVGTRIFETCLTGDLCEGRTRILVTHHLQLVLPKTSFLVELGEDGLMFSGPPGAQIRDVQKPKTCRATDGDQRVEPSTEPVPDAFASDRAESPTSISPAPRRFVQEETRQKGTVKASIYMEYVRRSGGLGLWVACIGIYLSYQAGVIGRAWWLHIWTGDAEAGTTPTGFFAHQTYDSLFAAQQWAHQADGPVDMPNDVFFYVKVYVAISLGAAVIGILRYISSYSLAVRASRALFKKMLFTVTHSPIRWLDAVPVGRILNRFTADFNTIDERIAMTWSLFLSNLLRLAGICVVSSFASVYLALPALLLLRFGFVAGRRYLVVSRPLKRIESIAKSPVFELFNTALTGISTIRAFRRTQTYLDRMHSRIDAWTMSTFYISLANRWMSFRMAVIAAIFSIVVGIVIVVNSVDAAVAGLALSFILDFSESLRWVMRCYGDMELEMNSMERAVEYMALETESLTGSKPPAVWPASGVVEFKNLELGYAPELAPVLKDLSFKIEHGQRVGVVGRTGAGKSSLTLALFRLLEARSGSIEVDGLDISKLDLKDLRSRMSIIPQHPVLFSGTIRSNLDPFDKYADNLLQEALARVHLVQPQLDNHPGQSAPEANIFRDLSSRVAESGGNISQGQQQLLCIARALLASSKVVVLDEATSAVDAATDTLIQQSIRDWFHDKTLIVIAHRLSTISDFDKILVLDHGRMVEFGAPRELWLKKGLFRSMCDSAGDGEQLQRNIAG